MDEEEQKQEPDITPQKMAKLKNLKAFRGWSDDQIKDYMKTKQKVPKLFAPTDPVAADTDLVVDEAAYKKKFSAYHKKYVREYGVDMNDANDAQQLESLVRFIIQLETVDEIIRQKGSNLDARTLKAYGDYQRTLQASITELQGILGISRKQRKEKQVDDVPQYIRALQVKAQGYWDRTTSPVRCPRCQIEIARYWLNFPKNVKKVQIEAVCTKCQEEVTYSA